MDVVDELAVNRGIVATLKETVDGEFTTFVDVAEVALLFASFPSNALTCQSLVVSHGWSMQQTALARRIRHNTICAPRHRVSRQRRKFRKCAEIECHSTEF